MQSRPAPAHVSVIDTLERVLDKGIVIDVWVRASFVDIELDTIQARLVVVSVTAETGTPRDSAPRPPGPARADTPPSGD